MSRTKIRKKIQDDLENGNTNIVYSTWGKFVTWKEDNLGVKERLLLSLAALIALTLILLYFPGIDLYHRIWNKPIANESLRASDNQPWVVNKIVDIKTIAGKSEEQVKVVLGEPKTREVGIFNYSDGKRIEKNSPLNTYGNGAVQIKFIEGKAARIFVKPEKPIMFSTGYPRALGVVGLDPNIQPSVKENNVIKWNNIEGLYEVAAKREDKLVSNVQVTIDEKYK